MIFFGKIGEKKLFYNKEKLDFFLWDYGVDTYGGIYYFNYIF
jgi:hypothetical protein